MESGTGATVAGSALADGEVGEAPAANGSTPFTVTDGKLQASISIEMMNKAMMRCFNIVPPETIFAS